MNVQMTGDIVLVRGSGTKSDGIVAVQRGFSSTKPEYSHAMIVFSQGVLFHSTEDGVHPVTYWDVFPTPYSTEKMRALRHVALEDSALQEQLRGRIRYYFGQAYNSAFILKELFSKHDCTSFCSELIAKAFRDCGIPLVAGKRPTWVFPVHLQALEKTSGWSDVTAQYASAPGADTQRRLAELAEMGFKPEFEALARNAIQLTSEEEYRRLAEGVAQSLRSSREIVAMGKASTEGVLRTQAAVQQLLAVFEGRESRESLPPEFDALLKRWNAFDWYWDQRISL